ncbi:MAG TPA: efflux RND transporter periplasmic adaptor subunit [Gemmatimonadales bacterium]|nr:efflux RND transporter periplasmic adaptor subunit [Gemmatimonadales bacterium]
MTGRWVVVIGCLTLACHGASQEETPTTTAVPVETAAVQRDTIRPVLSLFGRLEPVPGGSATLAAPVDAVAREVTARVGKQVHAGALLVSLDAPEWTTQARSLKATASAAEQEAQRQRDLFQQGITARRQLEESEAAATSARSAADAAERLLDRTRVTSPIDGRVEQVMVQPGERVSAGAPLALVVNGSALDLVASASPGELARLREGEPARVQGEGGTMAKRGWVRAVAPAVDSLTGTGTAILRIPEAVAPLLPGTGATAEVDLPLIRDALVVPDSALVLIGTTLHVFVIGADSVAHATPVSVVVRNGQRAAVTGQLKPGDRVATAGAYGLADGMRVIPGADRAP